MLKQSLERYQKRAQGAATRNRRLLDAVAAAGGHQSMYISRRKSQQRRRRMTVVRTWVSWVAAIVVQPQWHKEKERKQPGGGWGGFRRRRAYERGFTTAFKSSLVQATLHCTLGPCSSFSLAPWHSILATPPAPGMYQDGEQYLSGRFELRVPAPRRYLVLDFFSNRQVLIFDVSRKAGLCKSPSRLDLSE